MSTREAKRIDDRKDTLALVSGIIIVGSFICLMAGLVPLAIGVTVTGLYVFARVLTKAAL